MLVLVEALLLVSFLDQGCSGPQNSDHTSGTLPEGVPGPLLFLHPFVCDLESKAYTPVQGGGLQRPTSLRTLWTWNQAQTGDGVDLHRGSRWHSFLYRGRLNHRRVPCFTGDQTPMTT